MICVCFVCFMIYGYTSSTCNWYIVRSRSRTQPLTINVQELLKFINNLLWWWHFFHLYKHKEKILTRMFSFQQTIDTRFVKDWEISDFTFCCVLVQISFHHTYFNVRTGQLQCEAFFLNILLLFWLQNTGQLTNYWMLAKGMKVSPEPFTSIPPH